jgi:hypothetical protein
MMEIKNSIDRFKLTNRMDLNMQGITPIQGMTVHAVDHLQAWARVRRREFREGPVGSCCQHGVGLILQFLTDEQASSDKPDIY